MNTIINKALTSVFDLVLREKLWKVRFLPCWFFSRGEDMRVAFSALLRIKDADSYLLVRNHLRRYAFGPFGGVYKQLASARSTLDGLEFRAQSGTDVDDMRNDIRGFLPRKHILAMTRWFEAGTGREDATTCLRRELSQELHEIGLGEEHPVPSIINFGLVRRIQEGPRCAVGQTFLQYRSFDVYEITDETDDVHQFVKNLRIAARTHDDLLLASSSDIVKGRSSDGSFIGHHCGYLFGRRRVRPDEPMFVDRS